MPKAMIISLGGSPEPLRKSIESYRPEHVVLFASHDSSLLAGEVMKGIDPKPTVAFEITENHNSLHESYKAACRGVERIRRLQIPPEDVMVDFTGGTKVMTAALIFATIGHKFMFNYVGGDKRNKDGLGTVQDGCEVMYDEMSPWSLYAEEERRQVVTLFNRRMYASAMSLIEACNNRMSCPDKVRSYFRFVYDLADGYHQWEQFRHAVALRKIGDGVEALQTYLERYPDPDLESFLCRIRKDREFLSSLVEKTQGMKKYDMIIVHDLVSNARRRMLDKRYDDAAARIYRALELYGQVYFIELTGCMNNEVDPELIPESIRSDFVRKYLDTGKNKLKLPLAATFRFLKEKGHEAGLRFYEPKTKDKIKNIQSNRNNSILAHGIDPVSEKAMNSIFDTICEFIGVSDFMVFSEIPE
ncbi:MAG: TIGR02710 family CRISPR-associated CARF protein [Desulfomonilia bacterium]|jgi:CRISPR-associated protein (TIGR02710 family)